MNAAKQSSISNSSQFLFFLNMIYRIIWINFYCMFIISVV